MKCYYHKEDFDGICSAAVVNKAIPGTELIGANYHTIPTGKNDTIIIVDLSFSKAIMERLLNDGNQIIWIDHHKSALEQLYQMHLKGKQELNIGACELAWEFFFPNILMPIAVQYLGQYDIWNHKNPVVIPFNYGLRGHRESYDPTSKLWSDLLTLLGTHLIMQIISSGDRILAYQEIQDNMYAKGMAYTATFEGYTVLAINAPFKNSLMAKTVFQKNLHDFVVLFGTRDNEWKYSLFCDNPEIDVSTIAMKYGGGGHKGEAGFYYDRRLL